MVYQDHIQRSSERSNGEVMNRTRFIALVCVVFALSLAGCASVPSQQEIAEADYGNPMSAADCKALAQHAIASRLNDPGSAQFRNEQPCFKSWSSSAPLYGMEKKFGYLQKGEVNSKNAFGGYVGFRPYTVLIRDGRVVRSRLTNSDGHGIPMDH